MDAALIDETCEQFLGQWKRLVSTTNWDKGAIIHGWRQALEASGAPSGEFSDEAWSRRAGAVSPQHVGRLRRAYERFHAVRDEYPGLFWSHFQAALDWDDAEMWLEGAVQNSWSISEMRGQRWESVGALRGDQAPDGDENAIAEPWDDDSDPLEAAGEAATLTPAVVQDPRADGHVDDAGGSDDDLEGFDRSEFDDSDDGQLETRATQATRPDAVRPFASLPSLPADVSDAFEAYKLCILRHKLAGWQQISCDDLLLSLEALKQLALAPAEA
jgi:hypothetical protein